MGIAIKLALFLIILIGEGTAQLNKNPYRRTEVLDENGKYLLEWSVNWQEKSVTFNTTVQTKGYIGFGLSKKGKMAGADIVIGGVSSNGRAYFSDRHAIANQMPVEDASQDWTLLAAWENNTHTFLSFSRPFETCDEDHDLPINAEDTILLIWSYSERDDTNQYHFDTRGRFFVYLLDPDETPQRIKQAERSGEALTKLGDWKVWTISETEKLAEKDTTQLCTIHKAPRSNRKQHIVGYRPIFPTELERRHIHHYLVHRCYPPENQTARETFEKFLNYPSQECYLLVLPNLLPSEYCREVVYVWVAGAKSYFLPEHTGIPMNDDSPDDYYMLQVHYDNPELRPDIELNYHLEIFYTDKLRKNDVGFIFAGLGTPGSPSMVIPSHSINHVYHGNCDESCTRRILPSTGVKIFAANPHSHLAGRGTKSAHIRNGRELEPLADDNNFFFDFQPIRTLKEERTFLPGDSLMQICRSDTSDRNGTATIGGFSTHSEMCNAFVFYYPYIRIKRRGRVSSLPFAQCSSEIRAAEYLEFLGIRNYTWSNEVVENVVTSPAEYAGLTTRDVATRIDWTIRNRQQLQNYQHNLPQVAWCPDYGPAAVGQPSALPGIGPNPIRENNEYLSTLTENKIRIPYKRHSACSAKNKF